MQQNNQGFTKFDTDNIVHQESINLLPTVNCLVDKIMAQKKIRAHRSEVEEVVTDIMLVIQYFNSQDEYTTMLFNQVDIRDIKVPKELADFIVPASIKFDPTDLRAEELALRDNVRTIVFSYMYYVNLCDRLRAFFKKDASSDMVNLSDLKKTVSLVSIIEKASNDKDGINMVNYGQTLYYPVRMKDISFLYQARHFNALEMDLLKDYMAEFRF